MSEDLAVAVNHPDFSQLALDSSEIEPYLSQDGKKYRYDDPEAQVVLAEAQFRTHFQLNVRFERTHLCPRVGNRLNYILWLTDLVNETKAVNPSKEPRQTKKRKTDAHPTVGIDIGVGASAVYPLIGCALHQDWEFIGIDTSGASLEYAKGLIEQNNLQSRIQLIETEPGQAFLIPDSAFTRSVSFTVCNPPFYESAEQLIRSAGLKSCVPHSQNLVATDNELYTPGGEREFTHKLVEQSLALDPHKVQWYTTMVGKKETLCYLVDELRSKEIINYAIHEISHNEGPTNPDKYATRRWVVGWSRQHWHPRDISARVTSQSLRSYNPKPYEHKLDFKGNEHNCLETIQSNLQKFEFESIESTTSSDILVRCMGDVWGRSFRRRRVLSMMDEGIFCIEAGTDHITIWWRYGSSYKLFESFCGLIKSIIDRSSNNNTI